jgi:hypothetical protein
VLTGYIPEWIDGHVPTGVFDHHCVGHEEAEALKIRVASDLGFGSAPPNSQTKIHNMDAKNLIANAMEIEIRRSREALRTDVWVASVHYDNVKTLSETLHLLTHFETMILADQPDID